MVGGDGKLLSSGGAKSVHSSCVSPSVISMICWVGVSERLSSDCSESVLHELVEEMKLELLSSLELEELLGEDSALV